MTNKIKALALVLFLTITQFGFAQDNKEKALIKKSERVYGKASGTVVISVLTQLLLLFFFIVL